MRLSIPKAGLLVLQCLLAFGLLNALLSFENRWPTLGVRLRPLLSVELCVLLAGLLAWVTWRGVLSARAAGALALGFVGLVLVRYADLTAPAVMGRPVNLYWDGRHLGGVLEMLVDSLPAGLLLGAFAGGLLGLLLMWGLVRWAIGVLSRGLNHRAPRPWVWAALLAITTTYLLHVPRERDTRRYFAEPQAPTLVKQGRLLAKVLWPGERDTALGPSPAFTGNVAGLGGADVLLLFAESYGACTLDQPAQRAALAPARAALAEAIAASGRGVVSARWESPTSGGASWLSHAAVLAGVDTRDQADYDLLLTSDRPTLVQHFARHGYRTVGWMPGTKKTWPEGAFYGFDRLAPDAGIPYRGLPFGYWRIPDEAAMAVLHAEEIARPVEAAPRPPRFMVFPTTTTHAPFYPLPPLLDDWARAAGPGAYSRAQLVASVEAKGALQRPMQGYLDSMRYQFGWWASYLTGPAPRDLVLVIVGDHQPQPAITGVGANWDVPVHVVSSQPALLERLREQGFVEGLLPSEGRLGRLEGLTPLLLQAFDQPGGQQGPALPPQGLGLRH